jgi:hypothetical protein
MLAAQVLLAVKPLPNGINHNIGYEFWKHRPSSLSRLSFPGRFVVQDYLIRPGSALLSPAGYNVPLPCDPRFEGLGV